MVVRKMANGQSSCDTAAKCVTIDISTNTASANLVSPNSRQAKFIKPYQTQSVHKNMFEPS